MTKKGGCVKGFGIIKMFFARAPLLPGSASRKLGVFILDFWERCAIDGYEEKQTRFFDEELEKKDALEEIQGQVERVTWSDAESSYSVLRLKVKGYPDLVSAVGFVINPTPGEVLLLRGSWQMHPKFGSQFRIESYEALVPSTVEGIRRYLGSGLIRGLGPVMASRIVDLFGEKTLEVIEKQPGRLSEVEGIGEHRIDQIIEAWEEQREIRSVMIFLQSHGVSATYAAKIFARYGKDAVQLLQENPYRMASEIFGIGFVTADKIARNLGVSPDSPLRAEAGALYVHEQFCAEGNIYVPRQELLRKAIAILEMEQTAVEEALSRLVIMGGLHSEILDPCPEGQEDPEAIYTPMHRITEIQTARMVVSLLEEMNEERPIDSDRAIPWIQEELGIQLAANQEAALRTALTARVMVITGGPGTGKTTLIRSILGIRLSRGIRAVLAAPTGRAAKRMAEATGHEAKTIHRLLESSGGMGTFQRNEENPLECDLVIVDEASMIDSFLMYQLLKAIPPKSSLILVGDVNQLPSVGAGNILKDLIESAVLPVVELNEIFRQAKESRIVVNAHRVNEGEMPLVEDEGDDLQDFYFIQQEDPQKCLEIIKTLVIDRIPSRFGLDSVDDIQVLTPMHRGVVGAINLNLELQKVLNPGTGLQVQRGGRAFKAGDKVMQIRNNYDKDVYNGDIGRVLRIDPENRQMWVCMDNRDVFYEFTELEELVHAYAVSIHKSQGSEYPAVVIPVLTQHYMLLQRNLLYTGITRGKKLVVLVGTKKALNIALKNDKTRHRYTYLKERLQLMSAFREEE